MIIEKIWAVYFSPTGTTKKIVCHIAGEVSGHKGVPCEAFDFTLPKAREQQLIFSSTDFVVFGTPVYAGRVPNILLKYMRTIKGNGAFVVPVVLYGNRAFDDALIELRDLLTAAGFHAIAAGAFVGEHAFSDVLGAGRPDGEDLQTASQLAETILNKWWTHKSKAMVWVPGRSPSPEYYQPRDRQGKQIDIRKVKPLVNERCNGCGVCADVCPMGSIDQEKISTYTGICIKCGACIKKCPHHARYYNDTGYLYHKQELEEGLKRRSVSQIWNIV